MTTNIEFPRCKYCGCQDEYVYKCNVCGNWTCNDCTQIETIDYDRHGLPIVSCHHTNERVQSDYWKSN
jgi:hypothetical protein